MKKLYSLYCITTFVIIFLMLFPLFILFGIFGLKKWIWFTLRIWSILWLTIIGMRTKIIYDNNQPIKRTKSGHIVVANHQSYLDVALIFRAIPFMTRTLAKAEISKVPLFGYLYKQMTVLVKRDNAESKRKSILNLKQTIQNGVSVFIFPEGTFNETSNTFIPFYDGAFKIALETQTNILPMLFLDTAERFHYKGILNWTPGINRVVYLSEIDVSSYAVSDYKLLKQDVLEIMNKVMLRYKPHLKSIAT